jgi:PIN domain nuclease of toxin-antitoxin system
MPARPRSAADRTQRMLFSKRGRNIVKRAHITKKHQLPELDRDAIDRLVTVYAQTHTIRRVKPDPFPKVGLWERP